MFIYVKCLHCYMWRFRYIIKYNSKAVLGLAVIYISYTQGEIYGGVLIKILF